MSKIFPAIHYRTSGANPIDRGWRSSTTVGRLPWALLLVLFWSTMGAAIPLSGYRDQVAKAINSLDRLAHMPDGQSEAERAEFISSSIRSAREALPGEEHVEWQGGSFVADNSWFDNDLKELEESKLTEAQRSFLLDRVRERLQALRQRLEETDRGAQAGRFSKDEMQGRLAAILQRPEYVSEAKQETAIDRLLQWLREWLNKLLPKPRQLSPGGAHALTGVAQVVVAGLAVAVIAYCIWLVAPHLIRRRGPRKKKTKAEARVVLGERLEPDQSGADLLSEAEALARSGDLRGAIRKGYIALLVELGDRKVISLAQYKTNRDYLRSVREVEKLYGNMLTLTNSFESHWYGLQQASESDWTAFRAFYRAALS